MPRATAMTERAAPGRRRWRRAPVQVNLPLPDPDEESEESPGPCVRPARRAAVVARPHRRDCAGHGYRAVADLGGGCAGTGAPRARHRGRAATGIAAGHAATCEHRAPDPRRAERAQLVGRRPMRRSNCPSHPSCSSSTCQSAIRSTARSRSRSTRSDHGRLLVLQRLVADSNRDLRVGLNSSAFGAGEYRIRLQGYTWRGERVDVGWVRLVVE
jgi:hypothetical protein